MTPAHFSSVSLQTPADRDSEPCCTTHTYLLTCMQCWWWFTMEKSVKVCVFLANLISRHPFLRKAVWERWTAHIINKRTKCDPPQGCTLWTPSSLDRVKIYIWINVSFFSYKLNNFQMGHISISESRIVRDRESALLWPFLCSEGQRSKVSRSDFLLCSCTKMLQ